MVRRIITSLLMMLIVFLLSACAVPEWLSDAGVPPATMMPQAEAETAAVVATGTPLDAMAGTGTAARETQAAVPTPASAAREESAETCSDLNTGNSLTYTQGLSIAASSECTAAGDLLPAHFCNQNSGTWWIGLNTQEKDCNPACVVDVNSHTAQINWRCSGARVAAEDTTAQQPQTFEIDTPESGFEQFEGWQGIIYRQPHGSRVEYRFLRDDGQWFDIGARENDLRQQFASAAWSAAKVTLFGEETAVPGSLNVEVLLQLPSRSSEARNLTPFAMASASSRLAADEGGAYKAWSVVDGNFSQPWCEGVDGPGIGEWIQLDFTSPVQITAIALSNGYAGEGNFFDINNRVQTLSVILDNEQVAGWDLLDSSALQSLSLTGDGTPGVVTGSLRLVIEETIPGWQFDDTCLAELEIWGKPLE